MIKKILIKKREKKMLILKTINFFFFCETHTILKSILLKYYLYKFLHKYFDITYTTHTIIYIYIYIHIHICL